MEKIRASSKGQMIIPRAVRRALNIRPGTELEVALADRESFTVRLAPKLSHKEQIARLAGCLKRPGQRRITDEDMHAAVLEMAFEQDERTKSKPARKRRSR